MVQIGICKLCVMMVWAVSGRRVVSHIGVVKYNTPQKTKEVLQKTVFFPSSSSSIKKSVGLSRVRGIFTYF